MTHSSPPTEALSDRDRRGLLGSVGLTVIGQGLAYAAGFLCMILTTRLLGPEGYGRLAVFFMALECGALLLSWPNLGLVRFGREELGRTGGFGAAFRARMLLFALCAAVAATLAAALRRPLAEYLGLETAAPAFLLAAYLIANEMIFALRAAYQTAGAFRGYALLSAGPRVLNVLLIAGLFVLLARRATASGILVAQLAALLGVLAAAVLFLPRAALQLPRRDEAVFRRTAAYSWPLIFWSLASLVVNWFGLAAVKRYGAAADVGHFAVAWQAVTVLTALQVATLNAVTPLLMSLAAEKRRDGLTRYVEDALPQTAWAIGLGCVLLGAAAEAIPLLFGADYAPSVVLTQVLLAGVAFGAFAAFQEALVKALDRVKATACVMAALAAMNVLLALALTPRLGALGAAAAAAAALILSALLYIPIVEALPGLGSCGSAGRGRAWLGLLAPVVLAVAAVCLDRALWRLTAAAGILLTWLVLARAVNVFPAATPARLADMRMPEPLRRALTFFYARMGR